MRTKKKAPGRQSPERPKEIAEGIASRATFDRVKAKRTSQRAAEAADKLLRDMDDVLKHLPPRKV
jgi:hypothetical protein